MIVVHHLEHSRSQRVLWLLEEIGEPYEVKRYKRNPISRLAPPDLKKVHPLGKSPVIQDGGVVVAETGAIIEYLTNQNREAGLAPDLSDPLRLPYTYWLHFAEGTAMPQLLLKLFFSQIKETKLPFFVKPIANGIADRVLKDYVDPNINAQRAFINETLGDSEWFAGANFSAADVMMSYPLEALAVRGTLDDAPNIQAFLNRIHARPAYKRALEVGGPYNVIPT